MSEKAPKTNSNSQNPRECSLFADPAAVEAVGKAIEVGDVNAIVSTALEYRDDGIPVLFEVWRKSEPGDFELLEKTVGQLVKKVRRGSDTRLDPFFSVYSLAVHSAMELEESSGVVGITDEFVVDVSKAVFFQRYRTAIKDRPLWNNVVELLSSMYGRQAEVFFRIRSRSFVGRGSDMWQVVNPDGVDCIDSEVVRTLLAGWQSLSPRDFIIFLRNGISRGSLSDPQSEILSFIAQCELDGGFADKEDVFPQIALTIAFWPLNTHVVAAYPAGRLLEMLGFLGFMIRTGRSGIEQHRLGINLKKNVRLFSDMEHKGCAGDHSGN